MTVPATAESPAAQAFWQPMADPADVLRTPPTVIVRGEGVHVIDSDGRRTLDAVAGLWNVNLGHSCQPIKDAISAQLEALPYYSSFRGTTTDKTLELAGEVTGFFEEEGMARAFFTLGGSDSVEVALKLSRQYHRLRGEAERIKFIGMRKGYHGTHFGGGSINGNTKFRNAYEPLLPGCFHVPAPHAYRNPFDESDPERLANLCIAALEAEIEFQGANTVAAFIMEPVLGAGGVVVPHRGFMPAAAEVCARNGILLIADEVVTGFGRAGSPCGSRLWGVRPDIMTVAKAITCGYFPLGAVLFSGRVAEAFEGGDPGTASIDAGYTYSGHPVGAAAALASISETRRVKPHENASELGARLLDGLKELQSRHEAIGDVRGKGLMCAIELVSDPGAKTPIGKDAIGRVQRVTYEAGVMVRASGNLIILSPPLVIETGHVDTILGALDEGLKAV